MTGEQFLAMLPAIRAAARELGYAVGQHGSMARDYDIIVVPWTVDAARPDDVAKAIKKAAGGVRWRHFHHFGSAHGRIWYAFDWDRKNHQNRDYCDMSVMPRRRSRKRVAA